MGYYVHIQVSFACDENEPVAALASRHAATLARDACREALCFLKALSDRTGDNAGAKGGISQWGIIGNYTDVRRFVEDLQGFWLELLAAEDVGPLDFEHVIVLGEPQGGVCGTAYEIRIDEFGKVAVTEHELTFKWNQY